ncbi:VHS-domain-containing protein [Hesseltinella vesiculosa]|uniref:VHS-domain-containing protein n=1 Tax=Hesseltinella vesiculosa TaxID=101127 RepID=A0A1X2GRN8_9FUNG|nr:VHS-domain-containing protein [Hesseltinella vesiculosa]
MSLPLKEFIDGACSPARYEPDLALNLEICEMVNKKQGNAPRDAAQAIVHIVNSKNINQAMLALTLLDNCVKNCGYPFHLQVATKEFLNELVRRFPERPAPFPSPVIQRILYLIKEWKVALADMSKHKDDLVHIKDMYRLLRFKGYRFPELRDASVAALAPSENLKSAQELEEEDRVAQSAKLQELIRRGRPQDLVEANQLMKVMSGYDQREKPDYKQKFDEELNKIQDKSILLYEMLDAFKQGERLESNETIRELRTSCLNAQPKIQRLITEEEDNDKIENLLTLNDMINNVIAKYNDIQKGIFDTRYDIDGLPPSQAAGEPPKQGISLIDLDDDLTGSTPTPATMPSSALNDLNELFGQTSLSATSTPSPLAGTTSNSNALLDLLGDTNPTNATQPPEYSLTPPPASPTLPSSSFDSLNRSPSTPTASVSSAEETPESKPTIHLLNKNGLRIDLEVKKLNTQWKLKALFANASTAPMENLVLSLATPRSMQLKMETATSQTIPPKSENTVTQLILINNPKDEALRLRYKVTYQQFGVEMEQLGDYGA